MPAVFIEIKLSFFSAASIQPGFNPLVRKFVQYDFLKLSLTLIRPQSGKFRVLSTPDFSFRRLMKLTGTYPVNRPYTTIETPHPARGYSTVLYWEYGEAPLEGPTPYPFVYHFDRKVALSYNFFEKRYSFHMLS